MTTKKQFNTMDEVQRSFLKQRTRIWLEQWAEGIPFRARLPQLASQRKFAQRFCVGPIMRLYSARAHNLVPCRPFSPHTAFLLFFSGCLQSLLILVRNTPY